MSRHKLKPEYNAEEIMKDLLSSVVELYTAEEGNKRPTLARIGAELELNPLKVRKLLITAGVYESDIADRVSALAKKGMNELEIMSAMKLSRASVNSYLPYKRVAYKNAVSSVTADRIRKYRDRVEVVKSLQELLKGREVEELCNTQDNLEKHLWSAIELFANYPFKTAQCLKFNYTVKGSEMYVSRKEKSITKATVFLAFQKVIELDGVVVGPKKLGTFGASYLYPIFIRLGVIKQMNQV